MAVTLDSKIQFRKLCDFFEKVASVKGFQKYEEVHKFINKCRTFANEIKAKYPNADTSLFPVFRLILPKLERQRGPYGLQVKNLNSLFIRVFCLGKNSTNAERLRSNEKPLIAASKNDDLGERIYWILRNRLKDEKSSLTIQNINEFLDRVAECHEKNQSKNEIFIHFMRKITAIELKWLTRILLKDLKLALAQSKAFEALHPEAEALYKMTSNLRRVCDRFADSNTAEADGPSYFAIELFCYVKPMLLERFKIEDIGKLFAKDDDHYYVQTKFDGERSQLHMCQGRFRYFTRQGFDITSNVSFGETAESGGFLTRCIVPLLNTDCHSVILDGELMGWHKEHRRFGSKSLKYDVKKLKEHSEYQPCFVVYDILLYNDEPLLDKPYFERLNRLRSAFVEKEGVLMLCKSTLALKIDIVRELFNVALDKDDEGIVLKRKDALYRPNVRDKSGCYKIKAEYSDGLVHDLDLIVLGGYYGQGRYSGIVSSFLVGISGLPPENSKNGMATKFFAVVRVHSGLSDDDLRQIQQKLKSHWKEKKPPGVFGPKLQLPDVWVSPKQSLILEIRASEIIRTQAYPPLNYSLRFPRVLKIRLDKNWDDACTMKEFLYLVKDRGHVQKMTQNRRVRPEDICEVGSDEDAETFRKEAKIRKGRNLQEVPEAFAARNKVEEMATHVSRLFDGRELCVINDSADLSRDDVTALLLTHSARLVQNPGTDTFCVLVGDPEKLKARNVISCGRYDVVNLTWLQRATKPDNLSKIQEFRPWELFAANPATRRKIEEMYDDYWDSFVEDTRAEDFKRAMNKAGQTLKQASPLAISEMKKLDELLFDNHVPSFSVFRGITGYFHNPNDIEKYSFIFMSGTALDEFATSVDYVFIDDDTPAEIVKSYRNEEENRCNGRSIVILSSEWISDSFTRQTLLSIENYVL